MLHIFNIAVCNNMVVLMYNHNNFELNNCLLCLYGGFGGEYFS